MTLMQGHLFKGNLTAYGDAYPYQPKVKIHACTA